MAIDEEKPFEEWVRLEQPRLGTRVVAASDEFFGAKERLIERSEPVFIPDKYDEHGKWMDGWESRRRRAPGHDWCVLKLGLPGVVHGLDIDTRHFTGNYPPYASIDGAVSDQELPDEDDWRELHAKFELGPDAHHFLPVRHAPAVTHLRLNIFPDGGVARLRVYGEMRPDWGRFDRNESIDLLAQTHGGRALRASDEHFGSMHHLNLPERGVNMGDGWETARRRGPGHDWVVLKLGAPGLVEQVEIDTAYFKGNYPDRASLQAALVTDDAHDVDRVVSESHRWSVLLPESKLRPDARHVFSELESSGPVSHVRLSIYPDGGVSRLRLFGKLAEM
ncbi:MAG TPA: allantoicase [Woeseiaceae bacterium]|jgi:allantoicase|nr:allantoicase [Woeseiaceae bacterium]